MWKKLMDGFLFIGPRGRENIFKSNKVNMQTSRNRQIEQLSVSQ